MTLTVLNIHSLTQSFGAQDGKHVKSVADELQKVLFSKAHFSVLCSYAHLVFVCLVVVSKLLKTDSTPADGLPQGSYALTCNPIRCKFTLSSSSVKVGQPVLVDHHVHLQEECDC